MNHLKLLTDYVGVMQHSTFSTPSFRDGYTADDNARALIAVLKYHKLFDSEEALFLVKRYLSFLKFVQREDGLFHNLVSFDKQFLDERGSNDSFGRVLWASGFTINSDVDENLKLIAKKLFDDASKHLKKIEDNRSVAFSLMGTVHYQMAVPEQTDLIEKINFLAKKLLDSYEHNRSSEWKWFEEELTYCNARIPQALLLAFKATKKKSFLKTALESLDFLIEKTFIKGKFVPIGQKGWYHKKGKRALFDQQPIEASCMVDALALAHKITSKKKYFNLTINCFEWFYGKNTLNVKMVDEKEGACFDGLTKEGPNRNQGAESAIAFILAALTIEEMQRAKK